MNNGYPLNVNYVEVGDRLWDGERVSLVVSVAKDVSRWLPGCDVLIFTADERGYRRPTRHHRRDAVTVLYGDQNVEVV